MNRRSGSGFTIAELVAVILIIGILAVAAIPRLIDRGTFDRAGFNDQTLATLRYAQKAAIAQRRTVCATFTTSSVTLTLASAVGSSSCNMPLAGPTGSSTVTAQSGIAYTAAPSNFSFNAAGQASLGQTLQVSGQTATITVEQETGYVHP